MEESESDDHQKLHSNSKSPDCYVNTEGRKCSNYDWKKEFDLIKTKFSEEELELRKTKFFEKEMIEIIFPGVNETNFSTKLPEELWYIYGVKAVSFRYYENLRWTDINK